MKKNNRASRPWDLTKNKTQPSAGGKSLTSDPTYGSADNLVGWWNFSHEDTGKTEFVSKGSSIVSGSFINNATTKDQVEMPRANFSSPTFLKGIEYINNASATISDAGPQNKENQVEGFEITNFAGGKIPYTGLTVSMTFRLLQQYPLPVGNSSGLDRRINLLSLSDNTGNNTDGRLALLFDNDGYSSNPAITVLARDDAGTTTKAWQAGLGAGNNRWATPADTRNWIRIDFVIYNLTTISSQRWPYSGPSGASLYINGLIAPTTGDATSATQATNVSVSKISVGDLTSGFGALVGNSRIQLGEVAIWNKALTSNEIEFLWNRQQEKQNSGILSNPVRIGNSCGECEHDAYPTNAGSTDANRLGKRTPVFKEQGRFTLPATGSTINYPTLLESGSQALLSVGTLIATPNTIPTIHTQLSASQLPQGISNIIYSYNDCNTNKDASDVYVPFNDTSAPVDLATRVGQLSSIVPGFSSNAGNRIVIDIDVSTNQPKILQVITGSDGQTYGAAVGATEVSEDDTGLAYFNFKNGNFESIGGRTSVTGEKIKWCLPGEVSSSYAIGSMDNVTSVWAGTSYPTPWHMSGMGQQRIIPEFSLTQLNEDYSKVPRIFQPYSAMVSHRQTFNQVWATEFNRFFFYAGRKSSVLNTSTTTGQETLFNWFNANGLATGPKQYDTQFGLGYGGYSGGEPLEWTPYSSDIYGRGWQRSWDYGYTGTDVDNVIPNRIWNTATPAEPFKQSFKEPFKRTMTSMGRPIAYTDWCNSQNFHASSSQVLNLSSYIDVPMLLESIDIQASVDVSRLQQPYIKYLDPNGANSRAFMYSNTNNHIDFLSFFLMRQATPAPSTNPTLQQKESSRELITWSNHIFASPYVGWDWVDMNATVRDSTHPTSYFTARRAPMTGGARASRVFEVLESEVKEMVPAVDSFNYYEMDDGGGGTVKQAPYGGGGIFFNAGVSTHPPTDPKNTLEITGHLKTDSSSNMYDGPQPQRLTVTNSVEIDVNVPVRTSPAYLQKTVPILPNVQSNVLYDFNTGGTPATSATGGGPYFMETGGVSPTAPWPHPDWVQPLFMDKATQQRLRLKPRSSLSCMGTYWPGGSGTSSRIPVIPSMIQLLSSSLAASGSIEDNFTQPFSSIEMLPIPSSSKAVQPFNKYSSILVDSYSPSVRNIVGHPGAFQIPAQQQGGAAQGALYNPPLASPAGAYYLGESFNPTFVKSANHGDPYSANQTQYPATFVRHNPPPGFLSVAFTGSYGNTATTPSVTNSGYILNPSDELIFGVQWSPADAAHRSFKSIQTQAERLFWANTNFADPAVPDAITGSVAPPTNPSVATGTAHLAYQQQAYDDFMKGDLKAHEVAANIYRNAGFCESNDLAMVASASCTIRNRPMKLRLYGTLLRDSVQEHHSLDQQLTTVCVHEVVGASPILDEQDTPTSAEFLGSPYGEQISGSFNNNSDFGYPSDEKAPRTFSNRTVALNDAFTNQLGRGKRRSYTAKNLFDIGKVKRTVDLNDVSEYYYDSLVPNPSRMFEIDGAATRVITADEPNTATGRNYLALDYGISTTYAFTPTYGCVIAVDPSVSTTITSAGRSPGSSNRVWGRSFPFEPRYAGVTREFFPAVATPVFHFPQSLRSSGKILTMYSASQGTPWNTGFTTGSDNSEVYPRYLATSVGMTNDILLPPAEEKILQPRKLASGKYGIGALGGKVKVREDFVQYQGGSGWVRQAYSVDARNHVNTNFDLSGSFKTNMNAFFGTGDTINNIVGHYYYYLSYLSTNTAATDPAEIYAAKLLTQKPRGFKYGLISSVPKNVKATFRRDKYGQFRDMLEQRPYTKLYINDPADVRASRGADGLSIRINAQAEAAVHSKFVEPTWRDPTAKYAAVKKSPAETNCCNLSMLSTSSMPYFDGVLKNRDAAPTADAEVVII